MTPLAVDWAEVAQGLVNWEYWRPFASGPVVPPAAPLVYEDFLQRLMAAMCVPAHLFRGDRAAPES